MGSCILLSPSFSRYSYMYRYATPEVRVASPPTWLLDKRRRNLGHVKCLLDLLNHSGLFGLEPFNLLLHPIFTRPLSSSFRFLLFNSLYILLLLSHFVPRFVSWVPLFVHPTVPNDWCITWNACFLRSICYSYTYTSFVYIYILSNVHLYEPIKEHGCIHISVIPVWNLTLQTARI